MRVILDECVPRPLNRYLLSHDVTTVQERGWAGLKNGPLLLRMREASVEAFVTTDRSLEYQQTLAGAGFAVVVLVAASNTLEDLLRLVPTLLTAMERTLPGQVTHVPSDSP